MLILTRRIGETLTIEPAQDLDPDMTVRELFASGPLVIAFLDLNGKQARIGIEAPDWLNVVRTELRDRIGNRTNSSVQGCAAV